jgi:4-hydroxybenzoate polyprenyltransferase
MPAIAEGSGTRGGGLGRWWVYQRERFPIFAHGPIIAAFSSSAVSYSALLRGARSFPAPSILIAAFLSSFLFFLMLRICDEFKDAEEDARYRPYRPVPRGLVTLRELAWLAVLCGLVQAALAAWLMPRLLVLLLLEWGWLALMAREFFVSAWLRKRPVHYLWSHMLILPLMDFYLSAWDWAPSGHPPDGLAWLLGVSFLNGVVIEIGRKTRAPVDEEKGVETYSVLWGRGRAIAVWLAAIVITAMLALAAAHRIQFAGTVAIVVGVLLALVIASAYVFLRSPAKGRGKLIETMAGVWTLLLYTSLGLVPMAYRAWGGR